MDFDTDADDLSEALDGDALGEEVTDADRPGVIDFPPDRSRGSEDPSLFADDDLETRRERRDVTALDEAAQLIEALIDPSPAGALDHDPTMTADTADRVEPPSAEEAAMHVVHERDDGSGDG